MKRDIYQSPLNTRYASYEMSHIFSEEKKFKTFRKLWLELAKAQRELGLEITKGQIEEMEENLENIDFELAKKYEKELRHDVMAHIKTYGEVAKSASPIIHLGATSCYVTDNTDIILMREALSLLIKKIKILIKNICEFAHKYKELPTLGYTLYQVAQLTTVGKRATLWAQDFVMDFEEINYRIKKLKLRGVKGTTGTQASYMNLFNDDEDKVKELEKKVITSLGFKDAVQVTGQTYTRKIDYQVLQSLSSLAQSAHKMTNDIRLLQNLKELEEPFESTQVGSSAMAYKRNPMRSERVASLSKYLISLVENPALVASTQWLERTLDDSANKRLSIPEAFLAADAIVEILINITNGLVVNEKIIDKHIKEELPFMATENIIMQGVKKGGDRQELHEIIRQLSHQAAKRVKQEGLENNLIELLINDERIKLDEEEINNILNPKNYIGRCKTQVEEFIDSAKEIYENAEIYEVELEV